MLDFLFNIFDKATGFWLILLCIASIVVGFIALIKGADIFVSGASDVAKKLGVSSLIIGLTIVSIGTSLPEASVSITSALRHSSGLSIGNVVGSNLFNMLVVLGASCLFAPMVVNKDLKRRDLPVLVGVGVLLTLFTLLFNKSGGYDILRFEAIILLVAFVSYIVVSIITTKKDPNEVKEAPKHKMWVCVIFLILGGLMIACGGEFVTWGSKSLAIKLGADEILVGLTIVAIGTSLPELVTSIMAAKKHENEIAIGNCVGSSIFNILFILGSAATISPYLGFNAEVLVDIIFMLVVFIITLVVCLVAKNGVGKKTGIVFLLMYLAYFVYIILRNYCF